MVVVAVVVVVVSGVTKGFTCNNHLVTTMPLQSRTKDVLGFQN